MTVWEIAAVPFALAAIASVLRGLYLCLNGRTSYPFGMLITGLVQGGFFAYLAARIAGA